MWGKDKITDGGERRRKIKSITLRGAHYETVPAPAKSNFLSSQHLNTCRDTCRHAPLTHTKIQVSKHVKMHWSNISFNVQQAEKEASERKKSSASCNMNTRITAAVLTEHSKQMLGCTYTQNIVIQHIYQLSSINKCTSLQLFILELFFCFFGKKFLLLFNRMHWTDQK